MEDLEYTVVRGEIYLRINDVARWLRSAGAAPLAGELDKMNMNQSALVDTWHKEEAARIEKENMAGITTDYSGE